MIHPGAQLMLVAALMGGGQGQPAMQRPSAMGANYEGSTVGQTTGPAAPIPTTPSDVELMIRLHLDNQNEVALATLAMSHAYSEKVKDFANMLANDHTKADRDLANLASGRGISLVSPSPELRQMMDQQRIRNTQALAKLRPLSGAEFDRQFLTTLVQDHEQSIGLVKGRLPGVTDGTLRLAADRLLPTLQRHLTSARALLEHPGKPIPRARRSFLKR